MEERHPGLVAALESLTPVAVEVTEWKPLRLRVSAYLGERRIPDELITSVRCLVEVDGQIVVTESPDDVNVWPGGRREAGETIPETAVREIYEETGWHLQPETPQPLGFLHFEHLVPPPADYAYRHPDFVQLVFRGRASARARDDWRDTDGYVQRSWLESPKDVRKYSLAPVSLPFLDAL